MNEALSNKDMKEARLTEVLAKETKNNQMSLWHSNIISPILSTDKNHVYGINGIDGIDIMNRNVCH